MQVASRGVAPEAGVEPAKVGGIYASGDGEIGERMELGVTRLHQTERALKRGESASGGRRGGGGGLAGLEQHEAQVGGG